MEVGSAPSLRAQGPLEMLDGALSAVRHGGGAQWSRAVLAGLPLYLLALGIFYLERVEGVRSLRPLFAAAAAGAFLYRGVALSRVSRAYALAIRPTLPVAVERPRAVDLATTAAVVTLGLWVWLWPLAALGMLSPYAIAGLWPFLSLRGGVAPSWLSRAACAPERGLRAFGQAFDDTGGMRGVFVVAELLVLLGTLALFSNLYALLSLGLLVAHSMLGLDVAFVATFLSSDNAFSLLGVAGATLLCFEPLRAALSAQAFVDARSRRDGADLHAAVDAAIASSQPRRTALASSPPSAAALVFVLLGGLLAANVARAEPVAARSAAAAEARRLQQQDAMVRQEVEEILAGDEFREFARSENRSLADLLERFFRWLREQGIGEGQSQEPPAELPRLSPWVLMALAVIGTLLMVVYVTSRKRAERAPLPRSRGEGIDVVTDREPASHLDDAAALAERGDFRGALRALYVATLVTLDRRGMIEFDPAKTNWHYLRAMPRGDTRKAFATFTRVFDHKWYGHEPAGPEDYRRCRRMADVICRREAA
ncbi:MAG: DUF4129 domain-containing protein [Myxococcales bacterium]|jgi:hypothetical protein